MEKRQGQSQEEGSTWRNMKTSNLLTMSGRALMGPSHGSHMFKGQLAQ